LSYHSAERVSDHLRFSPGCTVIPAISPSGVYAGNPFRRTCFHIIVLPRSIGVRSRVCPAMAMNKASFPILYEQWVRGRVPAVGRTDSRRDQSRARVIVFSMPLAGGNCGANRKRTTGPARVRRYIEVSPDMLSVARRLLKRSTDAKGVLSLCLYGIQLGDAAFMISDRERYRSPSDSKKTHPF
jgi:hypothetical protein